MSAGGGIHIQHPPCDASFFVICPGGAGKRVFSRIENIGAHPGSYQFSFRATIGSLADRRVCMHMPGNGLLTGPVDKSAAS